MCVRFRKRGSWVNMMIRTSSTACYYMEENVVIVVDATREEWD